MKPLARLLLLFFVLPVLASAQEQKPNASAPSTAAQSNAKEEVNPNENSRAAVADASAKPIIYFYRTKQFTGSALEPTIFCDDKELARMDNGRYFGVATEPGKHTFRMGDKQTGFEIDMKAGQAYYARVTIEAGMWKGHGRLTLMQPEQGAFEIKKVKLLGADKVKDRSLVTVFEGSNNSASAGQ